MAKKIVIADKDINLTKILSENLNFYLEDQCEISVIQNFSKDYLTEKKPVDLVIMNYSLIFDKLALLKSIEQKFTKNIIIIFNNLQNRNENKNFINYKFLVKPFRLKSLFSIISDFYLKHKIDEEKIILKNNIFFNPSKKSLKNVITKQILHLTEKETLLIKFFLKNKNNFVSKKQLLNSVWGIEDTINTHTLETHMYLLKKKIEKIEKDLNLLFINQKGGYLLKLD